MRPLEQLNNVERAKLFHALFKDEIPAVLRFTQNSAGILQDQQEECRSKWENQLLTFDFWLRLARDVAQLIDRNGKRLEKSSSLFADLLFGGYHALYMAHCLDQYRKIHTPKNEKFGMAVELFFSDHPKTTDHEIL